MVDEHLYVEPAGQRGSDRGYMIIDDTEPPSALHADDNCTVGPGIAVNSVG